jgi:hypothetical protein
MSRSETVRRVTEATMKRQIWVSALLLLSSSGYAQPQTSVPTDEPGGSPAAVSRPSLTTATPHKKPPAQNPADSSAQRQSGLTNGQARSLLEQGGYTGVGGLHAEPNSIWVWQADAMKNGRRVRLGIDYRGNLLELSGGAARPCTTAGAGFGPGPLGTGARLSEADRCSGQ